MAGKVGMDEVRRRNRALLLAALRRAGPASRTRLSALTGLSSGAVSSLSADMLGEGLIAPALALPGEAGARGRPQAPLCLDRRRGMVAALSVAASGVRLRLVDYAGGAVAESDGPALPAGVGAAEAAATLGDRIDGLRAAAGPTPSLSAVALAVQGVVDKGARRVLWSPILATRGLDLAGPLEDRFGAPVSVRNDCAMMAEALHRREPDAWGGDFAVLLIGRGVGMGLYLGGAPFEGRASSAAEFGHLVHRPEGPLCRCGARGCVEAYAADYALLRAAGRAPPDALAAPPPGAVARLAAQARAGDGAARAAFEAAGEALGYGLGRLFTLVGPVPVAATGAGAAALDLMEPALRAGLAAAHAPELASPLRLDTAGDETALALEGAALSALGRLDAAHAARPAPGRAAE
jgi:predicted NBD/HSP70 family sugar kinase